MLEGLRALKGDGERCLRPGLTAAGVLTSSLSWPWLVLAGNSSVLEVSKRVLEESGASPL